MRVKNIIALCFTVILLYPSLGKAQSPDIFLARGHRPGQYYFYGPKPDTLGFQTIRTDDYGRSVATIIRNDTLGFYGFYPDAREGCLYAYSGRLGYEYWCRTFDRGESWERCEAQGALGGSPATGRIPGEIYSHGFGEDYLTIRYSNDYGDTYEQYRTRNNGPNYIVGHGDGEVYCTDISELRRSTDYGRNFEIVFEGDDSTTISNRSHTLKRGPEEGELYLFSIGRGGYYLSYSNDHGESFTRLCRVNRPPTDYIENWEYSFAPGLRAGEVWIGLLGYDPWEYWIKGCLIIYFSDDYGRSWSIYETSNNSNWHWDAVDPLPRPPSSINLLYNYPNPFNRHTTVCFMLPRDQLIKLEILDLSGRTVDPFFEGFLKTGEHRMTWPVYGRTPLYLPAGSYLCRFSLEEHFFVKRIVLIK